MNLIQNDNGESFAVLDFKQSKLIYDIDNICYIEGETLEHDQYHTTQNIQDVAQHGNVDRIKRILDLSVARCREILFPFTKKEVFIPYRDNTPDEELIYTFILYLPDGFSQTTLDYLSKLIHEYIVARAVYDWLSITNPQKREIWREKADEAESLIKSNLKARTGILRRRIHPF